MKNQDEATNSKRCPACFQSKPRAAFDEDHNRKDGLLRRCRLCTTAYDGMRKKGAAVDGVRCGYPVLERLRDWHNRIRFRCTDPSHKNYSRYGGAGIKCQITLDELYAFVVVQLGFDTIEKVRRIRIHRVDPKRGYCLGNLGVDQWPVGSGPAL